MNNFPFFLSAERINQVYFPILVPVGVIGNALSFLVRLLFTEYEIGNYTGYSEYPAVMSIFLSN